MFVAGDVLKNSATVGEPKTTLFFADATGDMVIHFLTDFTFFVKQLLKLSCVDENGPFLDGVHSTIESGLEIPRPGKNK